MKRDVIFFRSTFCYRYGEVLESESIFFLRAKAADAWTTVKQQPCSHPEIAGLNLD